MDKVRIEDIDVPTANPAETVNPLSKPLGTTGLAINYYVLAPGDRFGFDVHRHNDQEEVFIVLDGTATFELERDEITVAAGEVARFAPGEFQLGTNRGTEPVRAIALGAPRGTRDIEYLRKCPSCERRTVQTLKPPDEADAFVVTCNDCGTETVRESA